MWRVPWKVDCAHVHPENYVAPWCTLEMRVHSGYAASANCRLVSIITLSWCPERPGRWGTQGSQGAFYRCSWCPRSHVFSHTFCNEPSPASAWTLDATPRSIFSLVPRTGLDCLTASKTSYSKNRIWNPVLYSHLTNKLTVDFKSFCLFLLVSMTDSYSKKESEHESSLHCCVTMKTCI